MMLTDLGDAVRTSGLVVVEEPNWKTNGHGPMHSIQGVVCHHTAGPKTGDTASLNVVVNGRTGLSGPLANLYLSRTGEVHIVAAGLAYHAGVVLNPLTMGNGYTIGIEAEATGVDPWPEAQYAAYAKLCRALVDFYRLPVSSVMGHKEVASPRGRKNDPNFDMDAFRVAISDVKPGSTGGFLMALTDAEQRELLDGIRKLKPGIAYPARSTNCRVKSDDHYGHTMNAEAEAADTRVGVELLRSEVARLTDLVTRLLGQ